MFQDIWKISLRVALPATWWVAAHILMMQSTFASSPKPSAGPSSPYLLSDIILDWDAYEGYQIAVEADIKCDSEDYCFLLVAPRIRRSVTVDIAMLTVVEKQFLIDNCYDATCGIILTGRILDDEIMAKSYSLRPR
jgi:hypothetical protein